VKYNRIENGEYEIEAESGERWIDIFRAIARASLQVPNNIYKADVDTKMSNSEIKKHIKDITEGYNKGQGYKELSIHSINSRLIKVFVEQTGPGTFLLNNIYEICGGCPGLLLKKANEIVKIKAE